MKCYYHPEKETGVQCGQCKKPLCDQCAVPRGSGFLCNLCIAREAAREAVDGIDQRVEEKRRKADERKERKRFKKILWFALQWGIVLVGLCVMAYQVPDLISVLKDEKPLRNGTYKTDAKTDDCIRNLWRVAKILQEGRQPGNDILCPASKKPFIVTEEDGDVVARSPNPELYGFREIRVSKKRPVPEVIK
jgi:hypothetical protein